MKEEEEGSPGEDNWYQTIVIHLHMGLECTAFFEYKYRKKNSGKSHCLPYTENRGVIPKLVSHM